MQKNLNTTSFLQKKLIILGEGTINKELETQCTLCCNTVAVEQHSSCIRTSCKHLEHCTECRDYQIEKIFRCELCSVKLLGFFPDYCSNTCARRSVTRKSSALCSLCNAHLRKECKTCKGTIAFKRFKQSLKGLIYTLVRAPFTVGPQDFRPCAHYGLCKLCNKNIAKGHKGNSICHACRDSRWILESALLAKKKSRCFENTSPVKVRVVDTNYVVSSALVLGGLDTSEPAFQTPLAQSVYHAVRCL